MNRSRSRLIVAAAALGGVLAATVAPAAALSQPRLNWGGVSPDTPLAAEARSARTFAAPWGMPRAAKVAFPVSGVQPPPTDLSALSSPTDATSVTLRKAMNTSLRYALTTWWQTHFGSQPTTTVLNLGGIDEFHVRGPAMEAYALAIAFKTGSYDPSVTGVPATTALTDTIRLVTSLAKNHASNSPSGWGRVWQSRLWASLAGTAGWLLWDKLDTGTRTAVMRMVETEAGDLLHYQVPYYQAPDGTILFPGDSKAEEDSWDSMILQLALAMMPAHPDAATWAQKEVELMLAAYSRPQDETDNTIINGQPLSAWLHGSNVNPDGTVVNHGIIHPDYMATVVQNLTAPLIGALAGTPTPIAALHNADVVYGALTTVSFAAPPYRAPGGTIYRPDGTLYYPQSDDWGTNRIAHMVAFDELAGDLGVSGLATVPASQELTTHLNTVVAMQKRSKDGRSYVKPGEDTYPLREEWVAYHLGLAWLSRWVTANHLLSFTNASVLSATDPQARWAYPEASTPRF